MALNLDPITVVNLVLCVFIVVLGYVGYNRSKTKGKMPLYITIAFGLFGISHLATILGLRGDAVSDSLLIVIRTLGYLTVVYALYDYIRH